MGDSDVTIGELGRRADRMSDRLDELAHGVAALERAVARQSVKVGAVWAGLTTVVSGVLVVLVKTGMSGS